MSERAAGAPASSSRMARVSHRRAIGSIEGRSCEELMGLSRRRLPEVRQQAAVPGRAVSAGIEGDGGAALLCERQRESEEGDRDGAVRVYVRGRQRTWVCCVGGFVWAGPKCTCVCVPILAVVR